METTQDWSYALKAATIGMCGPQYTKVIDGRMYTIYKSRRDYKYYYHVQSDKGKFTYRSEGDPFYKGEANPNNVIALIETKAHVR